MCSHTCECICMCVCVCVFEFTYLNTCPHVNYLHYSLLRNQNQSYFTRKVYGGVRGVMVIVVGNGHGDTSSNPRRN